MTHDPKPARQPLLWAALVFSAGLWIGVRAWRPATWWVVAVLGLALAASWYVRRRAWMAKGLSLGTWFLLGALSIQIRGAPRDDPRLSELTDGSEVLITAHVTSEGYARARGPRSVSQAIDIETESIERAGEVIGIRSGVRLTVSEAVAVEEIPGGFGERTSAPKAETEQPFTAALKRCATQSPDARNPGIQNPNVQSNVQSSIQNPAAQNPGTVVAPSPCFSYGTRLRVRAKLHRARNYRNPGAFDYEGYLRDNGIVALGSAHATDVEQLPGFVGSRLSACGCGSTPASWQKFMTCGRPNRRRSWTLWFSAKSRFSRAEPGQNFSARALITC